MPGRIWRQRWRVVVAGGLWAWVILLLLYRMRPDQPWSDPLWLSMGMALGVLASLGLAPLPDGRTVVAFGSRLMNQSIGGRLHYALGGYGDDCTACLEARVTGCPDRTITGGLIPRAQGALPAKPGAREVSSAVAVAAR